MHQNDQLAISARKARHEEKLETGLHSLKNIQHYVCASLVANCSHRFICSTCSVACYSVKQAHLQVATLRLAVV